MARKTTAKKTTARKSTSKKSAGKKSTSKTTTRKSTAKKSTAKASSGRTSAAKRPAAKKTASKKKSTAQKATARKAVSKKKATAKKSTAKKAASKKKSTARKSTAKKSAAKKATTKKATTKKSTAKKTTSKKSSAKKPTSKKTVTKKTAAKAAPEKKAPAKKKSNRKSITINSGPKRPKSSSTSSNGSRSKTLGRHGAKSVAAAATASEPTTDGYVVVNGRRVRMISTKGVAVPKRKSWVAARADATVPESGDAPRKIKTKLSRKELNAYRALLLQKRYELVGVLSNMEDEALRSNGGNLSNMPLHMADVGTDTFDQDLALNMAESERKLLDEIDGALRRIIDRTYGVCLMTGDPIPKARLDAKPWAKYTIEAARVMEAGQQGS